MIVIEKILSVIALGGRPVKDQGGEQRRPVGVGASGKLHDPGHDLPGLVPSKILDQHLHGGFKVLVFNGEAVFGETFCISSADPLPHHRRVAEPGILFRCLVTGKIVGDAVDPLSACILIQRLIKRTDHLALCNSVNSHNVPPFLNTEG